MNKLFIAILLCSTLLFSEEQEMNLTSSSFQHNQNIPEKYTCEGESLSPQLKWENYPKETKSFLLIMSDPDAKGGVWNHWILYNIPLSVTSIKEGVAVPKGAKIAEATNREKSYIAPCPPKGSGLHKYQLTIYALDIEELHPKSLQRVEIEKAMQGHLLSTSTLIGNFKREKSFFFFF